ncbi:cupin domain-containing protein [Labrenzia sp. VG12]|uniref:cupin domain-containing protein n=1 Tax=Labrenzia sp. VG12 TaxID=2021862 RepID=UPI001AD9479B|nr:cupin domain-containing protein [Labrenzia sp. VG12]
MTEVARGEQAEFGENRKHMANTKEQEMHTKSASPTGTHLKLRFVNDMIDKDQLEPAPIRPAWILEGNPEAKGKQLAGHKFGWGDATHWSCTAGKFQWQYGWDESVMFLEGEVTITDENGNVYVGTPGTFLFFPAGTTAVWEVPTYIRKLAFNQKPVPWYLHYQSRIIERLKGAMPGGLR